MENIKKELFKNIKNLEISRQDSNIIKNDKIKLECSYSEKWDSLKKQLQEQGKSIFAEKSEELNSISDAIKEQEQKKIINEYKMLILKNNIDLLFYEIIQNELYPILHNYDLKAIGEKTKEKIAKELNDYMIKNYKIKLYFCFYKEYDFSNDYKLCFNFSEQDAQYNDYSKITLYKNIKDKKIFAYNNYSYDYIKNPDATAKKMHSDKIKMQEECKKLKNKIDSIKEEYSKNYLHNNTYTDSTKLYF